MLNTSLVCFASGANRVVFPMAFTDPIEMFEQAPRRYSAIVALAEAFKGGADMNILTDATRAALKTYCGRAKKPRGSLELAFCLCGTTCSISCGISVLAQI